MSNTNIQKTGVSNGISFIENGMTGFNQLDRGSLSSGAVQDSSNSRLYNITSAVTTSTWGSGFNIVTNKIFVPYGCLYRVVMEVYVPTAHKIVVDINNTVPTGYTTWAGNDNDLTSKRLSTNFQIPAETWTTITWSSENSHASNTSQCDIIVYDNIGLYTADDTAAVSWKVRNPTIYVGYNIRDKASVDVNNFYSADFIEI